MWKTIHFRYREFSRFFGWRGILQFQNGTSRWLGIQRMTALSVGPVRPFYGISRSVRYFVIADNRTSCRSSRPHRPTFS